MPEIIYSDHHIVVINKPAGMLSIPGRGPERQDSAASRICSLFQDCIKQPSVHRLDMDTSGLMVFALTPEAHRNLSIQFQNSEVHKKYIAILEGLIGSTYSNSKSSPVSGRIELKFRLNPANRPYQIYDPVNGKTGITIWKKLNESNGRTRVEFEPLTGRTHQLRLHSAHPYKSDESGGLGCPIVGDRLYGSSNDEEHEKGIRMLLHASKLEFKHPETSDLMSFKSNPEF